MGASKPLVIKNGKLERVPSFPPAERVAFLMSADETVHLTPVSSPYLAMGFPAGVFTPAYEELHYLDMILCEAAIEHEKALLFGPANAGLLASTGKWRMLMAEDRGLPLDNELRHAPLKPAVADTQGSSGGSLAPQFLNLELPVKSRLSTHPDFALEIISKQADKAKAEQAARDERLRKQTDNSDEQLRILTAQVEEGKRSQAEQEWSNRKALWLAAAALIVSILTGFWEAEELRAMVMGLFEAPPE